MKVKKNVDINKIVIFCVIIAEILYFIFLIASRALFIDSYMVTDFTNSEMDFFNMLAVTGNDDPYCEDANYPAMCFLILKIFHRLIPTNMAYSEDIYSGFFLRSYMPTQIAYTVFIIVIVILIYETVKKMYVKKSCEKSILAISMILSGPMIFSIERGNLIIVAFLFSLVYIALYDNENKYVRIFSYISLSIAASIKIYPAIFGVLTLTKKRYKETVMLLVLGIIIFLLPFFYFDGLNSLYSMLHGLTLSGEMQGNFGTGYNFSIGNFTKILGLLFHFSITDKIIFISRKLGIILCIVLFFTCKEEWKKVYALILLMIWMPEFSYTYTLIFLIIPFVMLLNQNEKNCIQKICLWLIGGTLIPYAIPGLKSLDIQNAKLPLTMPTFIINLMIVAIAVLIIFDNIIEKRDIERFRRNYNL